MENQLPESSQSSLGIRKRQLESTLISPLESSAAAQSATLELESDSTDSSQITSRTPMMDSKLHSPQPSDGLTLGTKSLYDRVYVVSQLVGLLLLVLFLIWVFKYLDGIGFSTPAVIFNFHPMMMLLGFVLLYSNSMLIYRTLRGEMKDKLKLAHAILNGSAMVVALFGSIAVFYFHQKKSITHFYSLHSWLGIATWICFAGQFKAGFVAFLFPGLSFAIRQTLMPWHRFIGTATFVLAIATCLTGLNEKAIFSFTGPNNKYSDFSSAGILTNLIGLVLVVYASLVVYLVTKSEYKRKPLPEEQVINLNFDLTSPN